MSQDSMTQGLEEELISCQRGYQFEFEPRGWIYFHVKAICSAGTFLMPRWESTLDLLRMLNMS